jgi:hypothetical protein
LSVNNVQKRQKVLNIWFFILEKTIKLIKKTDNFTKELKNRFICNTDKNIIKEEVKKVKLKNPVIIYLLVKVW